MYICNTHTFWNIYWHIEIYGKLRSIYFTIQKAFPTRLTIVMACASPWEPELRVDECQLDVNRAQNRPKKLRPGTKKVLSSAHKKVSQGGALLCGRSCLGGGTGSGAVSEVVAHGEEEVRQMAPTAVNMECPASGETRLQELAADVRALLPGSSLLPQDLCHLPDPHSQASPLKNPHSHSFRVYHIEVYQQLIGWWHSGFLKVGKYLLRTLSFKFCSHQWRALLL